MLGGAVRGRSEGLKPLPGSTAPACAGGQNVTHFS